MTNNKSNLVSVIIPTYNRVDSLLEAIGTVLNQTYKNTEIIIVDDNSYDRTGEAVANLEIPNIRIITNNENLGAPACRNTGLKHSKGDFIAFLDDDDRWLPEKIEIQLNYLLENPGIDSVFCDYKYCLKDRFFDPDKIVYDDDNIMNTVLSRSIGSFSLPLLKKKCVDAVGYIDINLLSCQDWDYWIRFGQKCSISKVFDSLVIRNLSNEQITADIHKKIEGRKNLLIKHHDIISRYPAIHNRHLTRLGSLNALAGNDENANKYLTEAFSVYPYKFDTITHLILNRTLPQLHKYLVKKYGTHNYGTVKLYH